MRPGAAASWTPVVLEGSAGAVRVAGIVSIMIASPNKALQAAWLGMLAAEFDFAIAAPPATDAASLVARLQHQRPGVLLLDKALLDRLDPMSLQRLREHCLHVRVLLLSDEIRPGLAADVLRNHFHGFLLSATPPEVCLKAIRAVCNGELWLSRASLAMAVAELLRSPRSSADPPLAAPHPVTADALTPRELQVVELLRRGCINKEIARELGIMEDTVKKHLQSVFSKLGVHRRALVAMRGLPGHGATHSVP